MIFISSLPSICSPSLKGKQELVPCDEWSGAAVLSSHPLNFQINKTNKTLPTSGMNGTSFWQSTRITGAREDGKGRRGGCVHLCHEAVSLAILLVTGGSSLQELGMCKSALSEQGINQGCGRLKVKYNLARHRLQQIYLIQSQLDWFLLPSGNRGWGHLPSYLSPANVFIDPTFTQTRQFKEVKMVHTKTFWKNFLENSWPALVTKLIIQPSLISLSQLCCEICSALKTWGAKGWNGRKRERITSNQYLSYVDADPSEQTAQACSSKQTYTGLFFTI